jgi:hypothetical protein
MGSITLLYYTANRIPERFAINVRNHLIMTALGKPIISISQKPIDFGENICVGDIGYNVPNVYLQILVGAKVAKTKYVACCEDDTLYTPEHFDYIPPDETFCYNKNRWNLTPIHFYLRVRRINMCACIVSTELMINTLQERIDKFGAGGPPGLGEPGRHERKMGLQMVKVGKFNTRNPIIQMNHRMSLGGIRRNKLRTDVIENELPIWGKATDLWEKMWNG